MSHHKIEIFSADCPLYKHVIDTVSVGKCADCNMIIHDTNKMDDKLNQVMKHYGVSSVPTVVIDGSIKVVGIPDFPWICGDDLYKFLKQRYKLKMD